MPNFMSSISQPTAGNVNLNAQMQARALEVPMSNFDPMAVLNQLRRRREQQTMLAAPPPQPAPYQTAGANFRQVAVQPVTGVSGTVGPDGRFVSDFASGPWGFYGATTDAFTAPKGSGGGGPTFRVASPEDIAAQKAKQEAALNAEQQANAIAQYPGLYVQTQGGPVRRDQYEMMQMQYGGGQESGDGGGGNG